MWNISSLFLVVHTVFNKYLDATVRHNWLADRTNGRAIGAVLRPFVVVCLYGMYCG